MADMQANLNFSSTGLEQVSGALGQLGGRLQTLGSQFQQANMGFRSMSGDLRGVIGSLSSAEQPVARLAIRINALAQSLGFLTSEARLRSAFFGIWFGDSFRAAADSMTAQTDRILGQYRRTIDETVKFESQMREIYALVGRKAPEVDATVWATAKRYGKPAADVAEGAYRAISSGAQVNELPTYLNQAGRLALAGRTSIAEATKELGVARNSWGFDPTDKNMGAAADMFFSLVQKSFLRVQDIPRGLGRMAPQAAMLGASMNEATAIAGQMIQMGRTPMLAFRGTGSLMEEVMRSADPGSKVGQAHRGIFGADWDPSKFFKERGDHAFQDYFRTLRERMPTSGVNLFDIAPNSAARHIVTTLTNKQHYDSFADKASGGAGSVETGSQLMSESWQNKIGRLGSTFAEVMNTVGRSLLGLVEKFHVVETLTSLLDVLSRTPLVATLVAMSAPAVLLGNVLTRTVSIVAQLWTTVWRGLIGARGFVELLLQKKMAAEEASGAMDRYAAAIDRVSASTGRAAASQAANSPLARSMAHMGILMRPGADGLYTKVGQARLALDETVEEGGAFATRSLYDTRLKAKWGLNAGLAATAGMPGSAADVQQAEAAAAAAAAQMAATKWHVDLAQQNQAQYASKLAGGPASSHGGWMAQFNRWGRYGAQFAPQLAADQAHASAMSAALEQAKADLAAKEEAHKDASDKAVADFNKRLPGTMKKLAPAANAVAATHAAFYEQKTETEIEHALTTGTGGQGGLTAQRELAVKNLGSALLRLQHVETLGNTQGLSRAAVERQVAAAHEAAALAIGREQGALEALNTVQTHALIKRANYLVEEEGNQLASSVPPADLLAEREAAARRRVMEQQIAGGSRWSRSGRQRRRYLSNNSEALEELMGDKDVRQTESLKHLGEDVTAQSDGALQQRRAQVWKEHAAAQREATRAARELAAAERIVDLSHDEAGASTAVITARQAQAKVSTDALAASLRKLGVVEAEVAVRTAQSGAASTMFSRAVRMEGAVGRLSGAVASIGRGLQSLWPMFVAFLPELGIMVAITAVIAGLAKLGGEFSRVREAAKPLDEVGTAFDRVREKAEKAGKVPIFSSGAILQKAMTTPADRGDTAVITKASAEFWKALKEQGMDPKDLPEDVLRDAVGPIGNLTTRHAVAGRVAEALGIERTQVSDIPQFRKAYSEAYRSASPQAGQEIIVKAMMQLAKDQMYYVRGGQTTKEKATPLSSPDVDAFNLSVDDLPLSSEDRSLLRMTAAEQRQSSGMFELPEGELGAAAQRRENANALIKKYQTIAQTVESKIAQRKTERAPDSEIASLERAQDQATKSAGAVISYLEKDYARAAGEGTPQNIEALEKSKQAQEHQTQVVKAQTERRIKLVRDEVRVASDALRELEQQRSLLASAGLPVSKMTGLDDRELSATMGIYQQRMRLADLLPLEESVREKADARADAEQRTVKVLERQLSMLRQQADSEGELVAERASVARHATDALVQLGAPRAQIQEALRAEEEALQRQWQQRKLMADQSGDPLKVKREELKIEVEQFDQQKRRFDLTKQIHQTEREMISDLRRSMGERALLYRQGAPNSYDLALALRANTFAASGIASYVGAPMMRFAGGGMVVSGTNQRGAGLAEQLLGGDGGGGPAAQQMILRAMGLSSLARDGAAGLPATTRLDRVNRSLRGGGGNVGAAREVLRPEVEAAVGEIATGGTAAGSSMPAAARALSSAHSTAAATVEQTSQKMGFLGRAMDTMLKVFDFLTGTNTAYAKTVDRPRTAPLELVGNNFDMGGSALHPLSPREAKAAEEQTAYAIAAEDTRLRQRAVARQMAQDAERRDRSGIPSPRRLAELARQFPVSGLRKLRGWIIPGADNPPEMDMRRLGPAEEGSSAYYGKNTIEGGSSAYYGKNTIEGGSSEFYGKYKPEHFEEGASGAYGKYTPEVSGPAATGWHRKSRFSRWWNAVEDNGYSDIEQSPFAIGSSILARGAAGAGLLFAGGAAPKVVGAGRVIARRAFINAAVKMGFSPAQAATLAGVAEASKTTSAAAAAVEAAAAQMPMGTSSVTGAGALVSPSWAFPWQFAGRAILGALASVGIGAKVAGAGGRGGARSVSLGLGAGSPGAANAAAAPESHTPLDPTGDSMRRIKEPYDYDQRQADLARNAAAVSDYDLHPRTTPEMLAQYAKEQEAADKRDYANAGGLLTQMKNAGQHGWTWARNARGGTAVNLDALPDTTEQVSARHRSANRFFMSPAQRAAAGMARPELAWLADRSRTPFHNALGAAFSNEPSGAGARRAFDLTEGTLGHLPHGALRPSIPFLTGGGPGGSGGGLNINLNINSNFGPEDAQRFAHNVRGAVQQIARETMGESVKRSFVEVNHGNRYGNAQAY